MRLQGYPVEDYASSASAFSNTLKCDLAGNAFCCGSFLVAWMSMMLYVPSESLAFADAGDGTHEDSKVCADLSYLDGLDTP